MEYKPKNIKIRAILPALVAEGASQKISIIIGPRQVGKTTLLRQLHEQMGGLFLDLDIYSNFEKVGSYENFINTIILNGYTKTQHTPFYVFLDEFQRYEDLSLVLKNIYDHHPNVKIYATGSSSITIKNHIQDSLTGRKHITYLYPLSFREFLHFKGHDDLVSALDGMQKIQTTKDYTKLIPEVIPYLNEFFVWGGYPEVTLTETQEGKQTVLKDIFDLYLRKDIVEYLKIEKVRSVKILLEQLAVNHGAQTNFNKYANRAGIDVKTAQNYTEIFSETFLLHIARPFFVNKNKEITKMPKVYFLDNGVRNYFINNFTAMEKRADAGVLLESYVIGELIKTGTPKEQIKYYRDKQKHEVDIIIDSVSRQMPIEIKYKKNIAARDITSIKKFMESYRAPKGYIVTYGEIGERGGIELKDCFNLVLPAGIEPTSSP